MLGTEKSDAGKVETYIDLFKEFQAHDPQEGRQYIQDALNTGKAANDPVLEAQLQSMIGRLFWKMGKYDSARVYHFQAYKIFDAHGQDELKVATQLYIGQDYADEGNYTKALEYILSSKKEAKEKKFTYWYSYALSVEGYIYQSTGNYLKNIAIQYESARMSEASGDPYGAAIAYANISTIMMQLERYDSVIIINKRNMPLLRKNKDWVNMSYSLTDLAMAYMALKQFSAADSSLQEALFMAQKTNDKLSMANAHKVYGIFYNGQNKYEHALTHLLEAKKHLSELGSAPGLLEVLPALARCQIRLNKQLDAVVSLRSFDTLPNKTRPHVLDGYQAQSMLDSARGNWKGAFQNYTDYIRLRDSLYNNSQSRKMLELESNHKYETKVALDKAEQEKKDALNAKELQKQILVRNIVAVASLIGIVLLFFVYKNYTKQKTANRLLREAQEELVRSEKKAAFGEVASRMSHEILNPLNFVNNFSEISEELLQDLATTNEQAEKEDLVDQLVKNIGKIKHNGKRAEVIVKQLQSLHAEGKINEFFEDGEGHLTKVDKT